MLPASPARGFYSIQRRLVGSITIGIRHEEGFQRPFQDLLHHHLRRPSITWGVLRIGLVAADQESGMKWRILVELAGADGSVQSHEISVGGYGTIDSSAETLGLTLAEGKK